MEAAIAAAKNRTVFRAMQPVYNGARHMKRTIVLMVAATLSAAGPPTVHETQKSAQKFIADAEARLLPLSVEGQRADWVKSTYITDDTEALAAKSDERLINATVDLAKKSTRFDSLKLPRGCRPQNQTAEAVADPGHARRSQGERGTHAHRRLHGGHVR